MDASLIDNPNLPAGPRAVAAGGHLPTPRQLKSAIASSQQVEDSDRGSMAEGRLETNGSTEPRN